jgi:nicotinamidase-related amidase
MRVGLLNDERKYDLHGVIERINLLTATVRRRSGKVSWVRQCGKTGDLFEPHTMTPGHVLVAGWATDFCVGATVQSAISKDHHVIVVADGHTLSDRPHLKAPNWVWSRHFTNRLYPRCHRGPLAR